MTKPKTPTVVRYRDSDSGTFVKKDYALANPKTTERQHIHLPTRPAAPVKKRT